MKASREEILTGNMSKTIFKLALPTMIAFLLHTGFNVVDTIFVGMISSDAIAAVTLVFPIFFFVFALGNGLGLGTASAISRFLGAGRKQEASNVAEHAYLISVIAGVFFAVIGLVFSREIFTLMGASESLVNLVLQYSFWILLGFPFMIFSMVSNSILRGEGDMKSPMIAMGIASIMNIILDPLFIFGIGPFPEMGVGGAAFATFLSRLFAFFYSTWFVFTGRSNVKISIANFKFKVAYIWDILKVGIPSSLDRIVMSVAMSIQTKIASLFGDIAIAAFGLSFRAESIIFMPSMAFGSAILTMVGQNIGAKNDSRARLIAIKGSVIAAIFASIIGLIFYFFPEIIIRVFTSDTVLIDSSKGYFLAMGFFWAFIATQFVIGSAFQGSGKGIPSFLFNFVRLFIVGIPLMYFFAVKQNMGLNGIWKAYPYAAVVGGLFAVLWFKFNKLGHKKLDVVIE
ncbi:MATE family efflux transporter [Candidatus Woesearchaeota archaeon]|nr:MATE family efflux transporter [Candidatus Woesearchaeota archaeon]